MPRSGRGVLRRRLLGLAGVGPVCLFLFVMAVGLVPGPTYADSADATIDRVMNTESPALPGVTATVRGSGGGWYGDSLQVTFENSTNRTYRVSIPIGLRFKPADDRVQTMLTAGNETIVVPPGRSTAPFKAFCGERHDAPPGTGDQFTPDGKVGGRALDALKSANDSGQHDSGTQTEVWDAIDADAAAESDGSSDARSAAVIGAVTGGVTGGAAAAATRRSGGGSGSIRPISGDAAIKRLAVAGHETLEIDGTIYVLPPDRLRPGIDGIAFETKTVDGHEVIDRDHVAIMPTPPATPAADTPAAVDNASLPPPEPAAAKAASAPSTDATTPKVVLSDDEKQRIVDWGVKNNRTPEDIQQDLDAQNETAGGTGEVPNAAPPVRVTLGEGRGSSWYAGEEVTLNAAEAEQHRQLRKEMKSLEPQIKNLRRELTWARIQVREWMASQLAPESRWLAGTWELIQRANRIDNPARYLAKLEGAKDVEELLVTKYGKPRSRDFPLSGRRYEQAVEAWRNGPDGLKFSEHTANIRSQAIRDIQTMTSPDPGSGATSWFNRPKKHLDTMQQYQEQLITSLKHAQARQKVLTDLERSFAERIRTGAVRE